MTHTDTVENAHTQMQQSISYLYQVFGKYHLQPHVYGCSCCVSDGDSEMLHRKRLRDLNGDDLYKFAFKAMTTWGDENDFRHFLPRLFELQLSDNPVLIDNEILFGKLRYGVWRTWPQVEQDAVERFLKAWGRILLDSYPCSTDITEYLCVLALVTEDVRPFLNQWRDQLHSVPAIRHLAQFAREHAFDSSRFQVNWWRDVPTQGPIVEQFLRDPVMESIIEAAYFRHANSEIAEELELAANSLRQTRV